VKASAQHGLFPDTHRIDWETPQHVFDELDAEFGPFELDVCATPDNAKCADYFIEEQNGLAQTWAPRRCWMNPPYGREIGAWVRKAALEADRGATIVALLPARTDTAWWHDYCIDREVRFIRGRLRFGRQQRNPAPFPSAIVVFANPSSRLEGVESD